jgi:hypothetical protein
MPNAGRKDKPGVIKTRPHGLISAADDIAEEIRARTLLTSHVIRIVKPHLGSLARVSDDLAITNILLDLRHYCDYKGISFKELDDAASELHSVEKTYEAALIDPARVFE